MKKLLHKSLSFLLVLTLVLGLFSSLSFHSAAVGSCGDNVTYTFDSSTGELVISGYGEMYNYGQTENYSPFYQNSNIKSIVVNNGVTSIGDCVFCECYNVTSVRINNSVKTIGNGAFSWCHKLETVNIPSSVTSIGIGAFFVCEKLASIDIPNSVTSLGIRAFSGCGSLTNIAIPDSITSISENTFEYCSCLTEVVIPSSITSIGKDAFINCNGLKKVVIDDVSAWCKISFENSVANPLCYAHNLYLNGDLVTELDIPNSIKSIGEYAFYGCSGLTSITIPKSITSIGWYAFSGCNNISKIHICDLEAWCKIAFYGANPFVCTHDLYLNDTLITELLIPDTVKGIGDYKFYGCSGLTRASIPSSVKSIGYCAFGGCIKLNSIEIMGAECSVNNDDNTIPANTTIINHGSKSVYDYAVKYNRNYICNHVEVIDHAREATCTQSALTQGTHCKVCGSVLQKQETIAPPLGHLLVDDVWDGPSCIDSGMKDVLCERCGELIEADIEVPSLGHISDSYTKYQEPTCTKSGYAAGICTRCLEEFDDILPALGHELETYEIVVSCTAGGTEITACTRCGEVVKTCFTEAKEHDYQESIKQATCTEEGYITYNCTRCGSSYTDGVVKALGHNYQSIVSAPSCTERGFTTYTCKLCSDTYVSDYVDALGHTPAQAVRENEIAPTCIKEGSFDEVVYCSVCKQEISRQITSIEKLDHDLKTVETIAPTYTEQGYDVIKCQRAGCDYSCYGNYVLATLASISFSFQEPISLLERADATRYDRTDLAAMQQYGEFYYEYNYSIYKPGNTITLTATDGTKEVFTYSEDSGEFVNAADECIYPEVTDTQSETTPWTVGTNYFTVSYGSKSVNVPVTIRKNPVVQIAFIPAKNYVYTEHTNGWWEEYEEWDDELNSSVISAYHYNMPYFRTGDMLYVTYDDSRGTVLYTYVDADMEFVSAAGERIGANAVEISGDTYDWKVGSNNYFEVSYLGSDTQVQVTIRENIVKSIAFTPAKPYEFVENSGSGWFSEIDEQTGIETKYCCYDVSIYELGNILKVNYKNGSSDEFVCKKVNNELVFINANGEEISPYENSQESQHNNPWKLGSNNYFTVEWLGSTANVSVTVLQNPVDYIEYTPVKPITYLKNTNGYSEGGIFIYNNPWFNLGDELVVYYKTGTSKKYTVKQVKDEYGTENCFVDNSGSRLKGDIYFESNQYDVPWTVGGHNYVTVFYMGIETRVPVTIENAHTYISKQTKPTTTKCGYTTYTCAVCGDSYIGAYTAPTGKPAGFKCLARTAAAEKFTWNKVAGVTGYQVQISTKDGKKWSTYVTLKQG